MSAWVVRITESEHLYNVPAWPTGGLTNSLLSPLVPLQKTVILHQYLFSKVAFPAHALDLPSSQWEGGAGAGLQGQDLQASLHPSAGAHGGRAVLCARGAVARVK